MSTDMPGTEKITGERTRPREVTGGMVLACLVAFFLVVAGVNIVMIRAAVSTFGGIETENAYQAGLAFAREIAAVEAQDTLHWKVRGSVKADAAGTLVEVVARDGAGAPRAQLEATARLLHPADKRADHIVPLSRVSPGTFSGRTETVAGQWMLLIELSSDGTTLFQSKNRVLVR
jgi:nitrogen fixation protein FixH